MAEFILPEEFLEDTDQKLRATNILFTGPEYCGISLLVSMIATFSVVWISIFFTLPSLPYPLYAIFVFLGSFVGLTKALPVYLIQSRVGELEEALPDALRQMSTALRAGVSVDAALEDVADSGYGALSEEFERTLAQIRRGRPIEGALRGMARRVKSDLYERAFFLIVEGMERGAELADVLESVSDDIRQVHTVQRERRAATMQQVLFLLAAALFAGPFIAGLVISVGGTFSSAQGGASGMGSLGASSGQALPESIPLVVPIYIMIQAAITALAVGVIRYGEVSKGFMYVVPFVGASIAVFYGASFFSSLLFPG